MSCRGEATKLGCGVNPYPFTATSREPTKWDRVTTTYILIGGENLVYTMCFYLRGETEDILQFRHEYTYNAGGDVIQMDVL